MLFTILKNLRIQVWEIFITFFFFKNTMTGKYGEIKLTGRENFAL